MNRICDHLKKYNIIWSAQLLQIFFIVINLYLNNFFVWITEKAWIKLGILALCIIIWLIWNVNTIIFQKKQLILKDNQEKYFLKILNAANIFFEDKEDDDRSLKEVTRFYHTVIKECVQPILQELNFIRNPLFRFSLWSRSGKIVTSLYQYANQPDYYEEYKICSIDEGIIGKIYRNNYFSVRNLPQDRIKWEETLLTNSKIGFKNKKFVQKLKMQIRSCCGLVLHTENEEKNFIAIFESTQPKGIDEKLCKYLMTHSTHGYQLKTALALYEDRIQPSLQYAKKLGV